MEIKGAKRYLPLTPFNSLTKKLKKNKNMNEEKKTVKQYDPPRVKVIEVHVEKGFAISGYGDDTYDDYEFGERF